MDLVELPGVVELQGMSAHEAELVMAQVDTERRIAEARSALLVARVSHSGVHLDDGHRTVASWGRAVCNWSNADARRLSRLADALGQLPSFAAACQAGEVPVSSMYAVANAVANPRVRQHVAAADDMFTSWARMLAHDDLVTALAHWTALADPDGSLSAHDRANAQRSASLTIVGERAYLDATGPADSAALLREVLNRFRDAEWRTEWDAGVAQHGEQMVPALMERTTGQRTFDALMAMCRAAAGSTEMGGEVTVNLIVDQSTFEHHLQAALGGTPEPLDPATAGQRRCEDSYGNPIDPRAMIAAALVGQVRRVVLDPAGVVVDVGRRRRSFTGALREAILATNRRCTWPGCQRPSEQCDVDHTTPFSQGGTTSADNAGPMCPPHNRWKHRGYRTWRDPDGLWHTIRPDGTPHGWPARYVRLAAA
jgi:Domain of unknown function (DUF222)